MASPFILQAVSGGKATGGRDQRLKPAKNETQRLPSHCPPDPGGEGVPTLSGRHKSVSGTSRTLCEGKKPDTKGHGPRDPIHRDRRAGKPTGTESRLVVARGSWEGGVDSDYLMGTGLQNFLELDVGGRGTHSDALWAASPALG